MKKVLIPALAILAVLLVIPISDECDAVDPEVMHAVTFVAGDRIVMTIYVYEGNTLSYIPGAPEGYSGWDTDLTQPIYEDTVVHAIPDESPLKYGVILVLAILLMFVVWDLLSRWYVYR